MRASLSCLTLLLAACGASEIEPAHPAPCDPYATEQPVAIPADAREATCGNDRIDAYTTACVERCIRGCGTPEVCSVDCPSTLEACDGSDLGDATCASAGFAGGALTCTSDCTAFDLTACDPCADTACREIDLFAAEDLELLVSGAGAQRRVRAFWWSEEILFSATMNPEDGSLGDPVALGATFERSPAIPTRRGFLVVVGDDAGIALMRIDERGLHREATDLPSEGGRVRAYARLDGEGAVLMQGELGSNEVLVRLVDAAGRPVAWPSRAVVGIHPLQRLIVVPAPRGESALRVGNERLVVNATRGERIVVLSDDGATRAGLLREGTVTDTTGDTVENGGDVVTMGDALALRLTAERIELGELPVWERPAPPATSAFAPIAAEGSVSASGDLVFSVFDADGGGPQAPRLVIAVAD